ASGNFTKGLISLSAGDTLSFQILTIPAGYSDATIAVTALSPTPEPASWAMMVGGFGAIGGAMRNRKRIAVTFA
ncbi:MAG TPA: PEPxxWA-CTERM sorting domain-containing protein, partial [Sphingomonas sp.]|nr:PEPxxWA-CTERM sorting domain-containing protein [Sphingomonas sp.]